MKVTGTLFIDHLMMGSVAKCTILADESNGNSLNRPPYDGTSFAKDNEISVTGTFFIDHLMKAVFS